MDNASVSALRKAQDAVAETDFSEDDILAEVMRLRYGNERP